jgi:virginiamycin B lyase
VPPSSAVLNLLPDGATKRRFILDCTGCHQIDVELAFPNGQARKALDWQNAIERMLTMAGAASGFPVISAEREAAPTARWLAQHLTEPPAAGPETGPAATVREYEYRYPGDLPHDLAVDADGHVVITGMFTHRMLRLDPETGAYEEFPIPVPQANPRALEIDGEGNWWVLLGGPHAVARYDPGAAEWSHWPIGMYGHSVQLDGEGRVWFNGHFTSSPPLIGYLEPETGNVRTFEVPLTPAPELENPIPYGLRVAPDGTVYGTELEGNRLVRLGPRSGEMNAWNLPTSHSGPRRLDVRPDGTVWIPQYSANGIASFDPGSETFTEYPLPVADALPYIVRVDAEGRLVVGTAAADAVLRFDPAAQEWETFPLPTRGALIRHMDLDPDTGDLWVAYSASPGIAAKIARVELGGG